MSTVIGVDGWSDGWIGVVLYDGRFGSAHQAPTLEGVLGQVPDVSAVAVDIPLGLVDRGWRDADTAAKQYLGSKKSSTVFMTPPRAAFAEDTHASGSAVCRELNGKGFSIQAWGLKPKLMEANSLHDDRVLALWEVHPEVSFTAMGLVPSDGTKKSCRGQRARLRLLGVVGIDIPDDLGDAGVVPTDDVLDAAAAAWTAHRIVEGDAISLPDPPQLNDFGQSVAIWY
jgi:predicted RNase H-like nuclease